MNQDQYSGLLTPDQCQTLLRFLHRELRVEIRGTSLYSNLHPDKLDSQVFDPRGLGQVSPLLHQLRA